MEIKLNANGWTVEVTDIKLEQATREQIHEISKCVETNGVVVIRGQNLTPEDEVRIMQTIGKVEDYSNYLGEVSDDPNTTPNPRRYQSGDEHKLLNHTQAGRKIFRVGGESKEGVSGIFGHKSTLDWHCNRPWDKNRQPVIWLYGETGTAGSRTSWLCGRSVWNDLDQELKEFLLPLKVINGHMANAYTEHNTGWKNVAGTGSLIFYENRQPVVHTNRRGVVSLDFPFLQVHHVVNFPIKESEELKEKLTNIMLQEKYMYHHDWQDGDVVIADQYMGLHKRWEFEGMLERKLHRIAGNYDNTPL
jgi:alpha-ketoglutarate-dependent taurine dioxygenase